MSRNQTSSCPCGPSSACDAACSRTTEPAVPAGPIGPHLVETPTEMGIGFDTALTWTTSGTFVQWEPAGTFLSFDLEKQFVIDDPSGIRTTKPPRDFLTHTWILRYANTLREFRFLGNHVEQPVYPFTLHHDCTPAERRKIHNAPQYPKIPPIPSLYWSSISRVPLVFSHNALYRPFIRRTSLDPPLPGPLVVENHRGGKRLSNEYILQVEAFVQSQFDLFSWWDAIRNTFSLVEQCVPMPRTQDGLTAESFQWKDRLRRMGGNIEGLVNNVDEVLTFAYELGGVGRWYCHCHIERLLREHDGDYFLGVDDKLIGVVFELPFADDCPSLRTRMEMLSRHGVPVFGVQVIGSGGSLRQDFVPRCGTDFKTYAMAVQSASLPAVRPRGIIFKQLKFTPAHPIPWIIRPTHGYPGLRDPSITMELALADVLYPSHNPLYTEGEPCRLIKSFFGHNLFPVMPPPSPLPRRPSSPTLKPVRTWCDSVGGSSDDEFYPHFEPPRQEHDEDSSDYEERVTVAARKFSDERWSVDAACQLLQDVRDDDRDAIERCQGIWDRGHGKKKRQLSAHDYHIVSNWHKYRPDREFAKRPRKKPKLWDHDGHRDDG
ncbi:uncharacterized protein EI90DRAFT_3129604 [Cantharellus anzutake]|uniref:uncharacterized protein n=1 Tax=Cantharellus anzutake TaxID=1750568 RepID=UPI001903B025|nr:uncharacterized protein EI90DRAFT_3129604 [Cantharellus anzutake]KAF8324670.1 hypothetical protein EI90DRAFT_3129604 [Cantharellus anzutake]